MNTVIRKLYFNVEKEEEWLNSLASKGLNFQNFSFSKYTFNKGTPGEYIYRIELLKNLPSNAESKAYFEFLEESNIEIVCTHFRWIFLRKKAIDGPFDIYSDSDSKISYYKRLIVFYLALILLLVSTNSGNTVNFISYSIKNGLFNSVSFITGIITIFNFSLTILLLSFVILYYGKIKKIKNFKKLFE